jgi:hypothetical protein
VSEYEGVVAAASPLELLHPAGAVQRVLVAGARCPANLLMPTAAHAGTGADLAVVAPSPAQLAQRGWLARSLATAASTVAQDGVVYALLPPAVRAAARRRLRAAGLELSSPVAQLPAGAPRYLVPVQPQPWRHMLGNEIGAHARIRRGLLGAAALPSGTRLLAESMPGVALVARRPHAAPLAAWLGRLRGNTRTTAHVAAMTSWRGTAGSVVLFCFAAGDDAPWGIAKLSPDSPREALRLERLGPDVRAAGARLPWLLATGAAADRPVLVGSAVEGRSAARVLMAAPERFADVAGGVADWLERWSAATARPTLLPVDRLERELLRHELPASYRAWLTDRCAALAATAIPLVAAHNDLTMWNVRLGESGALGVLDWAEAEGEALPLTDLFYAVADAAAACDGYRDRVAALRSCFEPSGARAATVAPLSERLRASLELSPAAAELCFHACWLRHAGNERSLNAAARPFAEIVRWLAHRTGTQ